MRQSLRPFLLNLGVLTGTLIIILILTDSAIGRYLHYGMTTRQSPNARYVVDNDAHRYAVQLNSDGFREDELPTRPRAAGKRVMLLGDSMLFGQGVEREDAFASIMEARLNEASAEEWEVLNLGIPGAGPEEYRDVLASFGAQLQPDLVIACYYTGNDALHQDYPVRDDLRRPRLWDNLLAGKPRHLIGFVENVIARSRADAGASTHAMPGSLTPNPLAPYLDGSFPEHAAAAAALDPATLERALAWRINPALVVQALRVPDLQAYHLRRAAMLYETPANRAILYDMQQRAEDLGAAFRVIVIPTGYTLDRHTWPFLESIGFQTNPRLLEEDRFEESIAYFCATQGIPCLNLRDAMLAAPGPLYFAEDTHMNTAGHERVAAEITPWLLASAPVALGTPSPTPTPVTPVQRWDLTRAADAAAWNLIGPKAAREATPAGVQIDCAGEYARIIHNGTVLDTSKINRLRVRMRADAGTSARFYWGSESATEGPVFQQARSASFPILADGQMHSYEIDLDHAVTDYDGTWSRFRFDPVVLPDAATSWSATVASIELGHAPAQPGPANPWAQPPFSIDPKE